MDDSLQPPNPVALLHVEDSVADVRLTQEALAGCQTHFQVTHLTNGEDALQFFQRAANNGDAKPDLILLDLNLPKVSGYELLKFLRSSEKLCSIPVIVLSGLVYADSLLGEYRSRVEGLLCKPEDLKGYGELAEEIEAIWRQSSSRSAAD